MTVNPMRKNKQFYVGIVLTIIEGLLAGCTFFPLYAVMKMLWAGTANLPGLFQLTLFLGVIFVLRLVIYGLGYTCSQIGGAAVSKQVRLFLGDKMKKIPLSRFTKGQTGQYLNIVTSDVNSYEKILTHTVGDLMKNIALSVMLVVFAGSLWLPGGIICFVSSCCWRPFSGWLFAVLENMAQRRILSVRNASAASSNMYPVFKLSGLMALTAPKTKP